MWKELIQSQTNECTFTEPATDDQISSVETALEVVLPDDLRSLLRETNGVEDKHSFGIVCSTERILYWNQQMRNEPDYADLYMPFEGLLLMGEDGGGDLFGYAIGKNGQVQEKIFCWDHETDDRTSIAWGLERYIRWYLNRFQEDD